MKILKGLNLIENMKNRSENIITVFVVIILISFLGFGAYLLKNRYITQPNLQTKSLERIADSLEKIVENQIKEN